jgi:hypothetical protein
VRGRERATELKREAEGGGREGESERASHRVS